jgi:signal recognition particle subunit SRP68
VKPLFFDTAWNYVDYPGQVKEVHVKVKQEGGEGVDGKKEEEKPAAKGWFGFGRR